MSLVTLPQLVPLEACDRCRLCCHFTERVSPWTPHVLPEELAEASRRLSLPPETVARLAEDGRGADFIPTTCVVSPKAKQVTGTITQEPGRFQRPADGQHAGGGIIPRAVSWSPTGKSVAPSNAPRCGATSRPALRGIEADGPTAVGRGPMAGSHGERGLSVTIPVALSPAGPPDSPETCYLCPCYEAATNRCRLEEARPLDCQLYPFCLAYAEDRRSVVLAADLQCPFLRDAWNDPATRRFAEDLVRRLETVPLLEELVANPGLIDDWQSSFVMAAPLPLVTTRLLGAGALLRPLRLSDREQFTRACQAWPSRLSAFAFPTWRAWVDTLHLAWREEGDHLLLAALQGDRWFLPVPPLGGPLTRRVLERAFELLDALNRPGVAPRVEMVPASQRSRLTRAGAVLCASHHEYCYRRADLIALQGDRYKSQRHLLNRFQRSDPAARIRPLTGTDVEGALTCYRRWAEQKSAASTDTLARQLREDAFRAHRRALLEAEPLGLTALVAEVEGRIVGYTCGYPVTADTACVMAEIALPDPPGLGVALSQQLAEALAGVTWLNAMGDEGLAGLRQRKMADRPRLILTGWTATRPL